MQVCNVEIEVTKIEGLIWGFVGYHMGAQLNFTVFKSMGTVLGHNANSQSLILEIILPRIKNPWGPNS